ncbi:rhodanese-like domain-containing protein [uncultured Croceitalea sp.]|uniref:rhodanese-like domain-containing protein n=1 Tax=uncultured Croceitalea sp. TaxID=1798908 RepID=UPI00330585B5
MNRFARVSVVLFFLTLMAACLDKNSNTTIEVIDKAYLTDEVLGKDVQLVDVRTPEEYEAGHIGDAVNFNIIDSELFLSQIDGLDKEKPVYLYCKMGGRSNRAAELMKKQGFAKIYDYSGGYNDWVSE